MTLGFSVTNSSGTKSDPHSPSGMDAEQPPEFRQRQFLVVDVDGDFPGALGETHRRAILLGE